jgi:hypothetical protein
MPFGLLLGSAVQGIHGIIERYTVTIYSVYDISTVESFNHCMYPPGPPIIIPPCIGEPCIILGS